MPKLSVRERGPGAEIPRATGAAGQISGRNLQRLGSQVSAAGQILQASSDQRAARKAAEFTQALSAEADAIMLDPNLEQRESKLAAARKRLSSKFRPNFIVGSPGAFDFRANMAAERLQATVKAQTNSDGISRGIADNDFQLDQFVEEGAKADNPSDRALAFIQGELALSGALESGLRDQKGHDKRLQKFRQDFAGGVLRRMRNDNPAAGLDFLEDEFDGTEEERQVWRGHMISSMRSAVSAEETELRRSELADRRREKVLDEEAQSELNEILGSDDILTVADVMDRRGALSAAAERTYLRIAESGGRITETATFDRGLYLDLSDRADRGEDIIADANAAFLEGRIDKTVRDNLVNASTDRRFGDARRGLSAALDPGILGDTSLREKKVQALQFFDEWHIANPRASREEAEIKARELVDGARTLADPNKIESFQIRPVGAVLNPDGRTVNVPQSSAEILRRFEAEEMTAFEMSQELVKLKRISDAQDAAEARQASRQKDESQ